MLPNLGGFVRSFRTAFPVDKTRQDNPKTTTRQDERTENSISGNEEHRLERQKQKENVRPSIGSGSGLGLGFRV